MVRRFSISPKIADLKALAVIAISLGVFISIAAPVRAESGSRVVAMQARVQSNIRVAQEYINRKEYMKADGFLKALGGQGDLVDYLSGSQKLTVEKLRNVVKAALAGRTEIAPRLKKSDELANAGRNTEAKQQLLAVRDSEYLTEMERGWIVERLGTLGDDVKTETNVAPQPVPVAESVPAKVVPAETVPAETVPAETAPAETVPAETAPAKVVTKSAVADKQEAEDSYIKVVAQRRGRLRSYTKAVVDDSVAKATKFRLSKEYDQADISLDAAFSTVDKNKMLLGDALYREYLSQLTKLRNDIGAERNADIVAEEEKARTDGIKLADKLRIDIERQRLESVKDYMERARAFAEMQQYEESLGQVDQLLAIDPIHTEARILKGVLENTVRWRQQLETEKRKDREEMRLLNRATEGEIPYEGEINYPDNWVDLTARRKSEGFINRDPADAAVYKLLEQVVDLSALTEETTLEEAMNIIQNVVDPPLPLVTNWNDISENAFIEKDKLIGISGQGLTSVTLLTGLERVIEAVSAAGDDLSKLAYVVDKGLVTVATQDSLPTEYKPIVYDVAELLSAPSTGQGGGGYGGGGYGG
ncbi:MAG: hypothetical protein J7M40_17665, partial [Planctomycetes bacterium]|nr:hypothetical protein [Planctomycetota bacterium]